MSNPFLRTPPARRRLALAAVLSGLTFAVAFVILGTAMAGWRDEAITAAGFLDGFFAIGPGVAFAAWIASIALGWPATVLLRRRGGAAWWQFIALGIVGGVLLSRFFWPRTPLLIVSALAGACAAAAAWSFIAWPTPGDRIEL